LRLVPKNLRNYLQTPTLIGCKFLTNPEATFVYFVLLCCDQRSLVVYHGFLSTVKLFSLSTSSFCTPQPSLRDAEAVSAEPSIMHCFFKPRQLRRKFFLRPPWQHAHGACCLELLRGASEETLRCLPFCVNTFWVLTQKGKPNTLCWAFPGCKSLTMTYFHTGTRTIIGADAFHCPVRDGKEWYHVAMVIRHNLLSD
jgi:hypothetical protein